MTMRHNEGEVSRATILCMPSHPSLGGGYVREHGLGVTPNPYLATGWIYVNTGGVSDRKMHH